MHRKFTQGPWNLRYEGSGIEAIIAENSTNGGDIVCLAPDLENSYENWRNGNRQLIAAAPELYEALEALLYWNEQGSIDKSWWDAAHDALAKANGEQP